MGIKIDKSTHLAISATELKLAKLRTAHKLSRLIKSHNKVIVGKSSDPANNRANYYQNLGYRCIFIIYQSKSSVRIAHLEAHLIDNYYDKIENKNGGSAGSLSETSVMHYLYVAVK